MPLARRALSAPLRVARLLIKDRIAALGRHPARDHYDTIKVTIEAPVKGFQPFDSSAHSPLFEEPARATEAERIERVGS